MFISQYKMEELIEEVCDIVGHHHHPREEETLNFKVIYDADLIANIEENQKEHPSDIDKLKKIIEKSFMTKAGHRLAEEVLLNRHGVDNDNKQKNNRDR